MPRKNSIRKICCKLKIAHLRISWSVLANKPSINPKHRLFFSSAKSQLSSFSNYVSLRSSIPFFINAAINLKNRPCYFFVCNFIEQQVFTGERAGAWRHEGVREGVDSCGVEGCYFLYTTAQNQLSELEIYKERTVLAENIGPREEHLPLLGSWNFDCLF